MPRKSRVVKISRGAHVSRTAPSPSDRAVGVAAASIGCVTMGTFFESHQNDEIQNAGVVPQVTVRTIVDGREETLSGTRSPIDAAH